MDFDYYKTQKEIESAEKKEIRKKIAKEFLIVFSGTISIIGFIVSTVFLIQMSIENNLTGRVIGNGEGNIYGLIILSILCLLWAIQMLLWFRKEKIEGGI